MKTIYKYPIKYFSDTNTMGICVPIGAKVISALDLNINYFTGYIYAIVDPELEPTEIREVLWYATGTEIDEEKERKMSEYQFLGSHVDEPYRWHIWVEPEPVKEYKYDCDNFENFLKVFNQFGNECGDYKYADRPEPVPFA